MRDLQAVGLLGLTAAVAQGGTAAGLADTCRVVGILGEGCASTALVMAKQAIHVAQAWRSGRWPDEIAALVGRAAVTDDALVNIPRVEPTLRSPARGGLPETLARRGARGGSVSGHKSIATGMRWMSATPPNGITRSGRCLDRAGRRRPLGRRPPGPCWRTSWRCLSSA